MRDHVQERAAELECRDLATLADNIWRARVARKPSAVAAVTLVEDTKEGEAAMATISARKGGQQPRHQQPKKPTKSNDFRQICWKHTKYGEKANSCVDTNICSWKPSLN